MAAIAMALSVRLPGRNSPASSAAPGVIALSTPPRTLAAPEVAPIISPPPLALGLEAARRGDLAEAERLFRSALARDPGDADAWNALGVVLIRIGDRERGIEALQTALRLAPGHADGHRNLGVALDRVGRRAEAIAHYERFLALTGEDNPDRAGVRRRLRELEADRGPA